VQAGVSGFPSEWMDDARKSSIASIHPVFQLSPLDLYSPLYNKEDHMLRLKAAQPLVRSLLSSKSAL
jgi:hypothetical protein